MTAMLDTSALAETAGPFKTFFERLAGPDGSQWFAAFKRFLRKEDPWPKFPIWKTVTLGTHKSIAKLRTALESAGFRIGDYAGQILKKVELAKTRVELGLVVVSATDLGFTQSARRDAVYARALEQGLRLCPVEVGPQLRLQYPDQSSGEWLLIAMEPLTDSDDSLRVFNIADGSGHRWLDSDYGGPDYVWYPDYRWVFVAPRKS